MGDFSIKEALKFGWDKVTSNLKFWVLTFVILFFLILILSMLTELTRELFNKSIVKLIIDLLISGVYFAIWPGVYAMALKEASNEELKVKELFIHYKDIFRFFTLSILIGLLSLTGLLFLVIPGLIISVRLMFSPYILVEKNLTPIQAIKRSWEITKGKTIKLLAFGFVCGVIQILGVLAFFVGTLITTPTILVAQAYAYKQLDKPEQ